MTIQSILTPVFFENICSYLELKDLRNLLLASKKINTEFKRYIKEYSIRSEILKTEIFINSLRNKPKKEQLDWLNRFCEDGNALKFKVLINSESFYEPKDYEPALYIASAKGHLGIMKAFIASRKFDKVKIDFRQPLRIASIMGHLSVINLFMDSKKFDEFSTDELELALSDASGQGHVDIRSLSKLINIVPGYKFQRLD